MSTLRSTPRTARTARKTTSPTWARIARVVERVRAIPKGFVRTYGDIEPAAPRFAGPVLAISQQDMPWHRVVRADGSVAMGARQRKLLRAEGVPFHGARVDLAVARLPTDGGAR